MIQYCRPNGGFIQFCHVSHINTPLVLNEGWTLSGVGLRVQGLWLPLMREQVSHMMVVILFPTSILLASASCLLLIVTINCFSHLELAHFINSRIITYWLLLVLMEGPDSVVYIGSTSISLWTTDLILMYADCIFYFSCLVVAIFLKMLTVRSGLFDSLA